VLRKRKCLNCDFRFYTYERIMSEEDYDKLQQQLREATYDTGSQSEIEREEAT